jgi:hypothetical protein
MAATIWSTIERAASDKSVTQPLPQISIPTPFQTEPINWGPRWNFPTPRDSLHLETFTPPTYGPLPYALATSPRIVPPISYSFNTIANQSTGNMNKTCPSYPIPLRNALETYNTKDGKHFGGYTDLSIRDIPSCGELDGPYMNWMVFATQPWARSYVQQRPEYFTSNSRDGSWSYPIPRWIDERLHGQHVQEEPEEKLPVTW